MSCLTLLSEHTCDISRFRRELLIWSLFSRNSSREMKTPDERFFQCHFPRTVFLSKHFIFYSSIYLASKRFQGFPDSPFWQFLLSKPCSRPSKFRSKGPEQCVYDQSKVIFIYHWICILMYFWFKRQDP